MGLELMVIQSSSVSVIRISAVVILFRINGNLLSEIMVSFSGERNSLVTMFSSSHRLSSMGKLIRDQPVYYFPNVVVMFLDKCTRVGCRLVV